MQEDGVVRTHVGRVVGKVNRLIETMAQKPCDMTTSFG